MKKFLINSLGIFLMTVTAVVTLTITERTTPTITTTTTPLVKTPLKIEEIFKARCSEYISVIKPELFKKSPKDCNELWHFFRKAFADKKECTVKPEDYIDFVQAADHYDTITDKLLLWNGKVYPFVIDFARQTGKYITIRDQLAVYILNHIENWCGRIETPGINYDRCPGWGDCEQNAVSSFWKQMSKNFVSKARGVIYVMFNASTPVVFNPESIFAKSELMNMDKSRTPILHAILVSNLHGKPTENCKTGSMKILRREVEKKGMKFRCWDNNVQVRHLQCLQSPHECSGAVVHSISLLLVGLLALVSAGNLV